MLMKTLAISLLMCAALVRGDERTAPQTKVSDAEVARVQRSALLIDTHNDVPSLTVDGFDIGSTGGTGMTDIARMRHGGMGAQFFSIYVSKEYVEGNRSAHRALEMIDTVRHDIIEGHPDTFALALTSDEIVAAQRHGKIAALLGIEGGHAIEDSFRLLRDYYLLGVRYMTLTHTNTNDWADSSGDADSPTVRHHGGLTPFGKQVVQEMNRLGMIVDISHVADSTFWDVLRTSSAPPIASHSSCRAIANVPRNLTDEMIAALAKKGGTVQINLACDFVTENAARAATPLRARYGPLTSSEQKKAFLEDFKKSVPRPTIDDVVLQITHVIKIGGIDAVGLGSDFDGIECAPQGLDDVSKWPNLTRKLLESGYSESDIRKIYGGNMLRVMRSVEAESKRLRAQSQ
jgi:membrane dipeptidase